MAFDPNDFEVISSPSQKLDPSDFEILHDPSEREKFAEEYTAKEQRGVGEKLLERAAFVPKMVGGVLSTLKGGIEGLAENAGEASTEGAMAIPSYFKKNVASIAEGAGRAGFDILNLARQSPELIKKLSNYANPITNIQSLLSRTPQEEEIEKAFQLELANKAYQTEREKGVIPSAMRAGANPKLAEAVSLITDPQLPASLVAGAIGKAGLKAVGKTGAAQGLKTGVETAVGALKNVPDAFKAPKLEAYAHDILKPTSEAAVRDLTRGLETGQFQDVLRNIRKELPEAPKSGIDVVEGAVKAQENLINKHNDFVKANSNLAPLDNRGIGQEIRDSILGKEFVSDAEKAAVNEVADIIERERTLDKSFNLLQELNEKRDKFYRKTESAQATDLENAVHEAQQIARDGLSSQLDKVYQAKTRTTDNPYRQYGSLSAFNDQLRLRLDKLASQKNISISKGFGLDREVVSTLRKNSDLLLGGELSRINNRTMRMFRELEKTKQPSKVRQILKGTTEEDLSFLLKEPRQITPTAPVVPTKYNRNPVSSGPSPSNIPSMAPEMDEALKRILLEEQLKRQIENQAF